MHMTHELDKTAKPVEVWTVGTPFSLDPIACITLIHHTCLRPLLASLVSNHPSQGFIGIIAASWSSNEDKTEWRFIMRDGLVFDNGDPITSEAVARAFARIAWVRSQQKSDMELLGDLCGVQELQSASGKISGLQTDATSVTFRFTKPQPDLLSSLSFSNYGITHPSNYDAQTGAWHDPKKIVASGPYRVGLWNDQEFNIQLREIFPANLRHPTVPSAYRIRWDTRTRDQADMVEGTSLTTDLQTSTNFFAPALKEIATWYIHIYSWNLSQSPFKSIDFRVQVREKFYQAIESLGIPVVRSFLPLSVPGIKALPPPEHTPTQVLAPFKVNCYKGPTASIGAKIFQALEMSITALGGTFVKMETSSWKNLRPQLDIDSGDYVVDLSASLATLSTHNPTSDIRTMALNKSINLPDPTGKLRQMAQQENFDLQKFNEVFYHDAIFWPITHLQYGFYIEDNKFDLSQHNFNIATTDLSWIGLKTAE